MPQHGRSSSTSGATKLNQRWLIAGQVLCHEGDAPGPLYVVCAGSVRVYRREPASPDAIVELARLGPGAVIGELAAILNQPRSATVEALEATQIVEVPPQQLGTVARRQTPLSRVITHALRERAGLSTEQLRDLAARIGLELADEALQEPEPLLPRRAAVPEHDRIMVYPKEVTCPACAMTFSALIFRPHKDQPAERATDFHQVYRTVVSPYDYEVWVCPNDLFAALPSDFTAVTAAQKAAVEETVRQVVLNEFGGTRPEFNVDRSLDLREQALQLALALYRMRGASPLRLAAVLHRLAWCARERGNTLLETEYLGLALGCYQLGYEQTDLGDAREELRVQYLCGELNLRLGEVSEALTWFAQALRHQSLKQYPKWEQMLRERWTVARDTANTAPAQESAA